MEIQKNVLLKNYTTFKIGGEAKFFCVVKNSDELKSATEWAKSENLKTFVLAGGSNVLISDKGFDGLVIRMKNDFLEKIEDGDEKVILKCGSGTLLSELMKYCLKNGFEGLEWAAGIPGTVGGAVRGNAGAFGFSIRDCVRKVLAISNCDEKLEIREFNGKECGFDYRESFFKKNSRWIIDKIFLEFGKGDFVEIDKKFKEFIGKRSEKQPPLGKFPSAGSIFKNPVVPQKIIKIFEKESGTIATNKRVPAGWLIDQCGLKGKSIGGAMVSDLQANFIVNTGNSSFEDVIILMSVIKEKVRNKFGVQLKEEIEIVI